MQHRTVYSIYRPLWDASGSNIKTKLLEYVKKKKDVNDRHKNKIKKETKYASKTRTTFHAFFTIAFATVNPV